MYGDKGSPCDKPLDGTICPLGSPFIIIEKEIVLTHSIGLFLKKKKEKEKEKKKRKEKKNLYRIRFMLSKEKLMLMLLL